MRRIALFAAAAAGIALLVPTGSASALGGTLSGSFLCENTLVTSTGTAGTAINAAAQSFTSTVVMPDFAQAAVGSSAQVTIAPTGAGTMPLSPPVALAGVEIDELQVRLDIYRSMTNSAVDITLPMDMSSGTAPVTSAAYTQAPGTAWALPSPFQVTVPVTGTAGQRAWVRVKSFGFTWSKPGEYTGSTTCRLAAAAVSPAGPTTVEQPIFGALTPLSVQFPVGATDVDLSGSESDIRLQLADRITFLAEPSITASECTVVNVSGCTTGQEITAGVTAGSLSQSAAPAAGNPSATEISLPPVNVQNFVQVLQGPLNPVTVTDVRGNNAGWSLTAELKEPFYELGGGEMAEAQASLTSVSCAPLAGSATHNPGSGGTLSGPVTLCGVDAGIDDSSGGSGSGQYTVTGQFELEVPPFQRAGVYTSTLIITLV